MSEREMDGGPVAHMDWRTMIGVDDDAPNGLIEAFDAYFDSFAQPVLLDGDGDKKEFTTQHCLGCGRPLTGLMAAFQGGGFTWGLAHGEGHCSSCKYPARGHHFIKDADGNEIATIRNLILQYHPDFVEQPARQEARSNG